MPQTSRRLRLAPVASAVAVLAVLLAGTAAAAERGRAAAPAVDERLMGSLAWREVGPYRGGRVAAVTGVAGQPLV